VSIVERLARTVDSPPAGTETGSGTLQVVPADAGWRPQGRPPRGTELTPREQEVVRLIVRGSSNRQIAETLVITERTAETHVRNIREKLGFNSRAQIAAWGVQRQILEAT
jgi:DNA-binding NarL/FixJ family response regulator